MKYQKKHGARRRAKMIWDGKLKEQDAHTSCSLIYYEIKVYCIKKSAVLIDSRFFYAYMNIFYVIYAYSSLSCMVNGAFYCLW